MTASVARRILITGFGPFPGVPVNISARVAETLTHVARERWTHHRVETLVLPTEWVAGPRMLHDIWDRLNPDIALHFGVAHNARGLQLETTAHNRCRMDPDASGALPSSLERGAGMPTSHAATLPFDQIARRLQMLRITSCISEDAGAYLCNAIFYESVARAAAARPVALSGFVHIPEMLTGAEHASTTAGSAATPMSIDEAISGGLVILECALEQLSTLRRTAAHSHAGQES